RLAAKPGELRAAVRFWTPARIRQAPLRGLARRSGAPSSVASASAGGAARGRPHRVPPLAQAGAQASSDQVADPTALPQRTVGLGRNSAGQRVGDAVGGVGLATGQPTGGQVFDAYGYPAAAPFDPNKQYHCQSPYLGADPRTLALSGPPTMEIGCDMTEGASG